MAEIQEEKREVLSLAIIDDLLKKKEFLTDENFLYDYLIKCSKEYNEEKKKNKNLKQYQKVIAIQKKHQLPNKHECVGQLAVNLKKQEEELDDSINIDSYYKDVLDVQEAEEFKIVLPPKNDFNFINIVNNILLRIVNEQEEAYKLLYSETDEILRNDLYEYIKELQDKQEMLMDYRDDIETYEESLGNQEKPLHLIFVPNEKENVSFLQEVKRNIQKEKRELVLNGLKDIINGKTKKYQRFKTTHGKINGFGEVKLDGECRILVDRTESTDACFIFIIGITQKYCYKNRVFINFLEAKSKNYNKYREQVIPLIRSNNIQDLIKNNEEILDTILQHLEGGVKYVRTQD